MCKCNKTNQYPAGGVCGQSGTPIREQDCFRRESLEGKRLLILGGSSWKDAIRDYANKHGITVIAAGNSADAAYFDIADETYLVDTTDASAMKQLIKNQHIDGVYMGSNEVVIATACQYLDELNLPCYCTKHQWDNLQNKANFKTLCKQYDLPVVTQYEVNIGVETLPNEVFPVITKPVDGYSSNGFSTCHNNEDLIKGYMVAKNASMQGDVLIEKFVNNDAIYVHYTFINGEIRYLGIGECISAHYHQHDKFVSCAHIFGGNIASDFRDLYEQKLIKLFDHLGLKNGLIWLEIFYHDGEYYFNEVGYRNNGSNCIYPIDYFCGINQVAEDIHYALTGKSDVHFTEDRVSLIRQHVAQKSKYCIYLLHVSAGLISKIEGVDTLLRNDRIVVIPFSQSIGREIEDTGTFNQIIGSIHFVFDTKEEFCEVIECIHSTLKIYDTNNQNMLNRVIDNSKIISL